MVASNGPYRHKVSVTGHAAMFHFAISLSQRQKERFLDVGD